MALPSDLGQRWPNMGGIGVGVDEAEDQPYGDPGERVRLALQVRAELESAGFDHGPLSVQAKLRRLGLRRRLGRRWRGSSAEPGW